MILLILKQDIPGDTIEIITNSRTKNIKPDELVSFIEDVFNITSACTKFKDKLEKISSILDEVD